MKNINNLTDEELLFMYNKYKRKRKFIISIAIFLFSLLAIFLIFNDINNKSTHQKQKDIEAPKIILKKDYVEIDEGTNLDYMSYIDKVIDNSKEDLLNKVTYNEIDTSVIGEYIITYKVADSSDNKAKAELKIKVIAKPKDEKESTTSSSIDTSNNTESSKQENVPSVPTTEPSAPIEPSSPPKSNSNEQSTSNQKIVKYYLFSDGYTMQNVASVCAEELKKIGRAGMCSPIQDENGIYLGMKLETN